MSELEIHYAASAIDALKAAKQGFYLDTMALSPDCQSLGEPEPGALVAYRERYGTRHDDPRFVVHGEPTEDATLAIAALAGIIPKPDPHTHLGEECDGDYASGWGCGGDLSGHIVFLVSCLCSESNNIDLLAEDDAGAIILAWRKWNAEHQRVLWADQWAQGVRSWRDLLTHHDKPSVRAIIDDARAAEVARRAC